MPGLTSTARGRAWLTNFDTGEKETALRLLGGLEMVTDTRFRIELKELLGRVRETQADVVAAIAVHNLPKNFAPHYLGCHVDHARRPPLLCPDTRHTGSEALVDNILRKSASALDIMVDWSIEDLYKARVDRLFLVTDNIASGQEIEQYLSFTLANKRIRSWLSLGWVQVEVIAHSITEAALVSLSRRTTVHYEHLSRSFSTASWSSTQVDDVRALCRKYSTISKQALGWKGAESLLVFGHTFGNGTPAILRQQTGPSGSPWAPLIPHERAYGLAGPEAVALAGHRARRDVGSMLRSLRDPQILESARVRRILDFPSRTRLLENHQSPVTSLLIAIDAGYAHPVELMKAASMSVSRLVSIARVASELDLVDGFGEMLLAVNGGETGGRRTDKARTERHKGLTLTRRGRAYLRRRSRLSRRITSDTKPGDQGTATPKAEPNGPASAPSAPSAYYPRNLR